MREQCREHECRHECLECRTARVAKEQQDEEHRLQRSRARDGMVAALSIARTFAEQAGEQQAMDRVSRLYYEFAPTLPPWEADNQIESAMEGGAACDAIEN